MSNKFFIAIGDDVNIFDATQNERQGLFNALRDNNSSPFFIEFAKVLRSNNVKSIYFIESDGTIDDLVQYYNLDPWGFIIEVESDGQKIY